MPAEPMPSIYEALGLGDQHQGQIKKRNELFEKLGRGEVTLEEFEKREKKLKKRGQRIEKELDKRAGFWW